MVIKVVEFPEELWATWVIAYQNLEISFRHWIAVLKNSESSSVWLHQTSLFITGWATLILRLTFLAGKDPTYMGIGKWLSWLEHDVSSTFWNFFQNFLFGDLVTRDFRPHRIICWVRNTFFRHKLIVVKLLSYSCLIWLGQWDYFLSVRISTRCCATSCVIQYPLFFDCANLSETDLSCKRFCWLRKWSNHFIKRWNFYKRRFWLKIEWEWNRAVREVIGVEDWSLDCILKRRFLKLFLDSI